MKHKKKPSLILLALLMWISISPFSQANPGGSPIIWADERQLTFDPVYWMIDPDTGKNITYYETDFDALSSVAATKDSKIWIVWQTDETGDDEIFYKVYNMKTGKWTNDTQLTSHPNYDVGPSILQTSDGKIWVFWTTNRVGNYEIFYTTTSDNGASWSTETPATTDPRSDVSPAVAQASDGKIWLVWSRKAATGNQDIYYKTYNGTSWSDDVQLTTHTNLDETPAVMQAKDGKIWVFWSRSMPDALTQIWYKSFDGSSWSSETQLTTEEKDNMDPAAFVEQDGTIWVMWQSKEQTGQATWDLFYKISLDNGTTWSLPIQFTTHKEDDLWPSATQAPDKSFWIVWTSNRPDSNGNDNVDLYLKFSFPGDVTGPSGVPDGIIDVLDLDAIKKAMPTTPSSLGQDPPGQAAPPWEWGEWNPNCDLYVDGTINILDLVIAAVNYGRHA